MSLTDQLRLSLRRFQPFQAAFARLHVLQHPLLENHVLIWFDSRLAPLTLATANKAFPSGSARASICRTRELSFVVVARSDDIVGGRAANFVLMVDLGFESLCGRSPFRQPSGVAHSGNVGILFGRFRSSISTQTPVSNKR